jgi:hypothetical protein
MSYSVQFMIPTMCRYEVSVTDGIAKYRGKTSNLIYIMHIMKC